MPTKKEVEEQRDDYRARLEDAYELIADALGYDADGEDLEDGGEEDADDEDEP